MKEQDLLIIGNGRLAHHLQHFYPLLTGHTVAQWDRSQSRQVLLEKARKADRIGLAISDTSLRTVADDLKGQTSALVFHFSGASNIDGIPCAHPLMTFGPTLFDDRGLYERIAFAVTGAASLQDLMPGLQNSWFALEPSKKALYHAWCVMAGNFPMLLWQEMDRQFDQLQVPNEGRRLYIQQVSAGYIQSGPAAITGPLVRKDLGTIQQNTAALEGSPWQAVYDSFVEAMK